jgi:phosphate-selective porin
VQRLRAGLVAVAFVFALESRARAEDPPPPTSPTSPAGYNVPIAQPLPTQVPDDHAIIDTSAVGHDKRPLAGYHNGLFYLRDHHDNFHLYIQGRMQLDFYGYAGKGVVDTPLKPTLFIRRVRPEVSGEFLGHWRFMIAGDFGATAIDNAGAVGGSPADRTRFQAAATDAYLNYRASTIFNVEVGQMDAPFTMENRTSDKYIPFAERSLAVRAVGIPTNKEIGAMAWGETADRLFFYSIGPYMGDGINRPNVDSRMDVFSRAFVHPLARAGLPQESAIRDLHVGASFHYGSRDHKWVNYDYPAMTTQAAWTFWNTNYAGSGGLTHIIPSGDQIGVAGELRIPLERFDFTSEVVYVHNQTREAVDGRQGQETNRYGDLHGISYYAQVGYWPLGNRDINGVPGYGNPPRLDWSRPDPVIPRQALQLLAKWEQVSLAYRSASRFGVIDAKNVDGQIRVNALSFGMNYWATRHVRCSLDYILDFFPGSAPAAKQTQANRAMAPGNTVGRQTHTLNELVARFAIAL